MCRFDKEVGKKLGKILNTFKNKILEKEEILKKWMLKYSKNLERLSIMYISKLCVLCSRSKLRIQMRAMIFIRKIIWKTNVARMTNEVIRNQLGEEPTQRKHSWSDLDMSLEVLKPVYKERNKREMDTRIVNGLGHSELNMWIKGTMWKLQW